MFIQHIQYYPQYKTTIPIKKFSAANNPPTPNFKGNAVSPLTYLICRKNLKQHVTFLASKFCTGRSLGTTGSERAREYIVKCFKEYGLKDFNKITTCDYVQSAGAGHFAPQNILGYIPAESNQYIFITAHYDHLGVDRANRRIFAGADDNASGVSVMLEVARILAKEKIKKNVVFVATDGEELGCLGAYGIISKLRDLGLMNKVKVINIDSVGVEGDFLSIHRRWENKNEELTNISVQSANTLGLKHRLNTNGSLGTDAQEFERWGIPAISYTWALTEDNINRWLVHTTDDTEKHIHYENIEKAAQVALNTILTLAK